MIQTISDQTFHKEVVSSDLPVVLNITADWCEPCKKLYPIMERVAASYEGLLKICSLNVSHGPKTVAHYHVMSVPTLLFIRKGQVVGQHVGGAKATDLARKIESHLGVSPGGRSYAG
jgi:thioredoxin